MISKWLTLVEGLPSAVIKGKEPEVESFLLTFFQNMYHVDVSPCEILNEEQDGSIILTITGRCGTSEIGYNWKRTKYIGDSSEDHMLITTYGLSGVSIRWSYSLWKSGYEYKFQHGWLGVAFADAQTQEQFTQGWLQAFGIEPHFREVKDVA